jgi:hypothetical protein
LILALLRSRYWATRRRPLISAEVEAAKAAKRSVEQAKNTGGSNGRNIGQILGIALPGLACGATRTTLLETKEGQEISAIPRPNAPPSKGEKEGTLDKFPLSVAIAGSLDSPDSHGPSQ